MLKFSRYPVSLFLLLVLAYTLSSFTNVKNSRTFFSSTIIKGKGNDIGVAEKYAAWNLKSAGLSQKAFSYALKGYTHLIAEGMITKDSLLTIIDFSQPSSNKRLYIVNMVTGKILFNTLVAHGHNSGCQYATKFSNSNRSHQSSIGFYVTLDTYYGNNGYSLRLKGCEKGFNDHAFKREIVLHGADYVNENFIQTNGFLGRSFGCPAVPMEQHKDIIESIKNGSCLFIYYPAKKYLSHSKILNS